MNKLLTCPQCLSLPTGSRLNRFTSKTQALHISPFRGDDNLKHLIKSCSYFLESVNRELKYLNNTILISISFTNKFIYKTHLLDFALQIQQPCVER